MKWFAILSSLFFTLCCCCSSEGFTKVLVDFTSYQKNISGDEFFTLMMREPTKQPSEIKNFQGVEVNTLSYRNYYLRYKADKEFILDLVSSMPSSPSTQLSSNADCRSGEDFSDEEASKEFLPSEYNKIGEIEFWKPEKIKEREYYICLKLPFSHTMLFDKESKIVYHVIEELVDW